MALGGSRWKVLDLNDGRIGLFLPIFSVSKVDHPGMSRKYPDGPIDAGSGKGGLPARAVFIG